MVVKYLYRTAFVLLLFVFYQISFGDEPQRSQLIENFKNPPMDCRPHTRWWWMGNAGTLEDITFQLEEMKEKGIGGVEQITMGAVYEKGNKPYLSDEYFEMVRHTVKEAKRLGLEVSFNFGGPGWIIGGEWIADADKSKDMVPTFIEVKGPALYDDLLPQKLIKTKRSWEHYSPELDGTERLLAVVAGKLENGVILQSSLTVLTNKVVNNKLTWKVPDGTWRIMAFWLKKNGIGNAVDHFNKDAMQRYCRFLFSLYKNAVGEEFGKTIDSFFCDSFELANLASGIYWSEGLLPRFKQLNGYDLVPFLPALWWNVENITPKIRYDVNEFLHKIGMEAFFETFLTECEKNGVKGRIQAYGFTTDNIQASGRTPIPEMEITPGEKDAADWFDTRIGPKKYVASGAHIYGRDVISTEAFTFMHWRRYRATLEELKIASDGYLRSGATKFYNHGYCFSPEILVCPSRTIGFAAVINHQNIWWKYYLLLSQYIARASYFLRQGDFVADIAVYSPLANQWTIDVLNPRKWTREFDWGELGKLILSNGYDFDLLNDDALQNLVLYEKDVIKIRNQEYKILILPNITSLPLETLKVIEQYVRNGGTVIALERVPEFSIGFENYRDNDSAVQMIVAGMFDEPVGSDGTAEKKYGQGHTYHIKNVLDRKIWWDRRSHILDPFIKTLKQHVSPDFSINFAHEDLRENEGLSYLHRKSKNIDIYFVANTQDRSVDMPVTFRVHNCNVSKWDPCNGRISNVYTLRKTEQGVTVPLKMAPYASFILMFEPGETGCVTKTNFDEIFSLLPGKMVAGALTNGTFTADVHFAKRNEQVNMGVDDIPAPFIISGEWDLHFKSTYSAEFDTTLTGLESWTDIKPTRHFSGECVYRIKFDCPAHYIRPDFQVMLDPGRVCNIADIVLNSKHIGTVWMRNQKLDVTGALHSGKNELEIYVTNTLINYVSSLKEPVPVPKDLVSLYGPRPSPSNQLPREFGFKPLPASGLLGPVKLSVMKIINIPLKPEEK